MSLRKRLANFLVFIGAVALLIFILDLTSLQDVRQWGALLVGLAALALGIFLRPGRDPARPAADKGGTSRPGSETPAAIRPNAPPPAARPPARPGLLAGLLRPKAPPAKAVAPPPPPPTPKKGGLAGLFKPKTRPAPAVRANSPPPGKGGSQARPGPAPKKR
jgi:hypothetical protein